MCICLSFLRLKLSIKNAILSRCGSTRPIISNKQIRTNYFNWTCWFRWWRFDGRRTKRQWPRIGVHIGDGSLFGERKLFQQVSSEILLRNIRSVGGESSIICGHFESCGWRARCYKIDKPLSDLFSPPYPKVITHLSLLVHQDHTCKSVSSTNELVKKQKQKNISNRISTNLFGGNRKKSDRFRQVRRETEMASFRLLRAPF